MIFLQDAEAVDREFRIEETLARALDMYSDRTTPKRLATYVIEQAFPDRPTSFWGIESPDAIRYLCKLALALTPPDDKRMSFKDRPGQAAAAADPRNRGAALNVLVAMGWGNHRLHLTNPTAREIGTEVEAELDRQGRRVATALLDIWKAAGHAHPI